MKRLQERGGSIQVLGSGAGLGAAPNGADGYNLFLDTLEELARAARSDGVGVALIVDELQILRAESLGALVEIVQQLRDELPLGFIGGRLPYLPGYIAKVATSTERFRFERTGLLVRTDARPAVVEPARLEGVSWDADALEDVVDHAKGYPYFLQLYASETWAAARARHDTFPAITQADVATAVPVVERLIENGMYESRYEQLGPVQLRYVNAMADLLGETRRPAGSSGRATSHERSGGPSRPPPTFATP